MPLMSLGDRILRKRYFRRKACITATLIILYTIAAIFIFAIIFLGLNHFINFNNPKTVPPGPWDQPKLPESYDATHYDLFIYPDFYKEESYGFQGNVTISLMIHDYIQYILIHKKDLYIKEYKFLKNLIDITDTIHSTFQINDYWVLKSKSAFKKGNNYQLKLEFWGQWQNESFFGFYRSSFTDEDGEIRYLVSTQFEPAGARRAFPCLDEPHRKSKFTIHLVHKTSCAALSNMPQKSYEYYYKKHNDGDLLQVTHFHTNKVPMSTYLVAYVVAQYYGYTKHAKDSVQPIRIFGPRHRLNETKFSGQVAVKMRQYLERTYEIEDPMPKIDMIYIPNFSPGAMENWGLITYRDSTLMLRMGQRQKYFIIKTITHELCHIFFGNLVTMQWWNDIWLNEGFATYCQIQANNQIYPEYKPYEYQFQVYFLGDQSYLRKDTPNSKKSLVRMPIKTVDVSNFGTYVYIKGAGLLIWLETIVGKTELLRNINLYLREHQYKTATTEDLWRVFDKNSALNYSNFTPWLEQKGYPLVSVSYNPQKNKFIINQKQCCHLTTESATWPIYLQYRTSEMEQSRIILFNSSEAEFSIEEYDNDNSEDWILFNSEAFGLYRVVYDNNLWLRLCNAFSRDHNQFNIFQRARLVDDAFTMSSEVLKPLNYSLDILSYMINETNYLPWASVIDFAMELSKLPEGFTFMKQFEWTLSRTVSPVYEENDLYAMYTYIQISCTFNHTACLDRINNYSQMIGEFEMKLFDSFTVIVYYMSMVANNSQENFEFLWTKFNNTEVRKYLYIPALLMTKSEENFQKMMKEILINKRLLICPLNPGCPYPLVRKLWNWIKATCILPKKVNDSLSMCRLIVKRKFLLLKVVRELDTTDDLDNFLRFSQRMILNKSQKSEILQKIEFNIFKRKRLMMNLRIE